MSDRRNSSPLSLTDPRSKSMMSILSPRSRRQSNASVLSDSSATRHGFRGSVETVFEKFKGEGQYDDDRDHGIKKLVPQRIKSKHRRRRTEREEEERAWQAAVRGRSVAERGSILVDEVSQDVRQPISKPARDDDASSTLTYDSETGTESESLEPLRPTQLVSHPSHIGYLTSTSPAVQTSQLPLNDPSLEHASAPIQHTSPLTSSLPTSTGNLIIPIESDRIRSLSPAAKIREVLSRKSTDQVTGVETNRKDEKDISKRGLSVSTSTQAASVAEQRRGSVSARLSTLFPVRQQATSSRPVATSTLPLQSVNSSEPGIANHSSMPAIVNTPPTPIDTTIPQFPDTRPRGSSTPIEAEISRISTSSPIGGMLVHRRGNSTTLRPSKLSNSVTAPLTPTLEQTTATPTQSGFFSSVLSAAQNAANSLTNTIGNTPLAQKQIESRSRSTTLDNKAIDDVEVESVGDNISMEEKEPAVKTMGQGDLNLSHLGIVETPKTTTPTKVSVSAPERGRSETKDGPIATLPRAQTASVMLGSHDTFNDYQSPARPRSVYEAGNNGQQTPPYGSATDLSQPGAAVTRSGSVKSKLGGVSRKRNSSAATAITTSGATIVPESTTASAPPKMAGFAVASKKRNRDFHEWFRSVPDDDYLIEDYSCALQREILAHGRLYVSEGHLCFSSNILGWATTLVMSFDEIVAVEKRNTAMIFRNGLEISTLHAKHIFASFTSRDSTYDLIVGIWKLGHPSLRSSLNGVRIAETGGGDRTEKVDGVQSDMATESEIESDEDEDDVYDEDDDEGDDGTLEFSATDSVIDSEVGEKVVVPASRKASAANDLSKPSAPADKGRMAAQASGATLDFPGPATHAPTECQDQDTHYEKCIGDEIISAPLGKIYNLIFGPASGSVMSKWLTGELKCLDLQWDDKKALNNEHKSRNYSYVKPLFGAIGPKQTKCLTTEVLDFFDLEKAVSLTLTTQTPDVPSGNVFCTKTKYCLTWAEGSNTRLQAFSNIEWTGKSWLKGPIEKGANEGMVQYTKDLCAMLRASTSSRDRASTNTSLPGKKGKKGKRGGPRSPKSPAFSGPSTSPSLVSWGIFEPIRPLLEPVISIFSPLLSGNTLYVFIGSVLLLAWFAGRRRGRAGIDNMALYVTPQRIAAYEEMWRREESELWEWLEDRVGLDRLNHPSPHTVRVGARNSKDKVFEDQLSAREVEEAIRVTEGKLKTLKEIVKRTKGQKNTQSNVENNQPKVTLQK